MLRHLSGDVVFFRLLILAALGLILTTRLRGQAGTQL